MNTNTKIFNYFLKNWFCSQDGMGSWRFIKLGFFKSMSTLLLTCKLLADLVQALRCRNLMSPADCKHLSIWRLDVRFR